MGKEWRVSTTLVVVVGVLVLSIILVAHPGTAAEATTKTVPFFTPPPNVFPPPYLGAILYAGVGPVLYAVEPQAAKPITTPLPLSPSSGAVIEALTVDPIGRTVYALVSDVAAAATPVLIEVAFNGYKMSVTGQAALPDVPVNVTKGAITYSAKYQGVIVRTQFDNTAYIVSVPSFTVSKFTALSISGHASGDIFAYDDQGRNQSWAGPASIYTEVDTQTGDILYFDLMSGTSYTTGKFQSPPTLTYYDSSSKFFYALGLGYIYYGPNLPTSTVDLVSIPFGPSAGVIPLRFIAYSSYIAPGVSFVWASYSDGTLRKYLIANGSIKPLATANMSSKAIAFLPSDRNIQPFSYPGLPTAIVDFADTPELVTNLYSAKGVLEKLYPKFGNFYFPGGGFPSPTIWDKQTDQFLGGSGLTSNLIQVTNTGDIPMYTYFNAWNAPLAPNVSFSLSTIYNPVSSLHVASRGLEYDYNVGAVKFTASIQGDLAGVIFNHNKSHILNWGFCLYDDQKLGKIDPNSYEKNVTEIDTIYTFVRPGTFSISLKIPSLFVSDGVPESCPHTFKVDIDESGNLRMCIEWNFPYSDNYIFYDPDIALILTPDGKGDGGGDGGANSKALQIAIPVAVGGMLALCCLVIVVAIIALAITKRHEAALITRRLSESVTFTNDDKEPQIKDV
eukprot:TRINITY_DN3600_c0_g1_i1.p1 TRINITY_DN3600_c0_g1~~TRINITY_DN3600_c0_g1_i1.p1  ORF type:complete len:673 (-),score=91.12 TRINITY_DN3600_c0_g1_i1:3-2021(-)